MKSKMSVDEIKAVLDDPESVFSTTPHGAMEYARFLAQSGTIKTAPQRWQDMFIAPLHGRDGT